MADPVETADALAVAREAAGEAVAILVDAGSPARGAGARAVAAKRPRDFVTDADRASEEAIVTRIQSAFPDHEILAEESGGRGGGGRYRWIVDPLDGTTNFFRGFPVFAVSIALYEGEAPLVGVVVDVVRGEWFTARAGDGARIDAGAPREGRAIAVAETPDPGRRLLATGFPFRNPHHTDRYLAAFRALFGAVGDMRRAGSAALDLAWVAAGRVDGFWELGLSPWDVAAGEILVKEAGGRVTDWRGGPGHQSSGWIAAGNPTVHALLVEILAEYAEDEAERGS